jgi:hypothetical protein
MDTIARGIGYVVMAAAAVGLLAVVPWALGLWRTAGRVGLRHHITAILRR